MFDWTWPTIQESSPALGVKQTQSNTPQRNQKGFFFLSPIWVMPDISARQEEHNHNTSKRFFSFFVVFKTTTTWSQPPVHHHWHGDHSAQCHRPHAHTQTHSYGTSIQAITKKWQQIERRKGGGECDDLPNRPCVQLVWCYCMSDETWFKRWKLMQ